MKTNKPILEQFRIKIKLKEILPKDSWLLWTECAPANSKRERLVVAGEMEGERRRS